MILSVVLDVILGLNRVLEILVLDILLVLLLERHAAVDGSEVVVDGLLPHWPVLQQFLLGDARVDRRTVGSLHQLDLGLAFGKNVL